MPIRDEIIRLAKWWADPGEYKPLPDELVSFFEIAETEAVPTYEEAKRSLATLATGVFVGGAVKHWCGIFACHILRRAGVNVRWTLMGGTMKSTTAYQVTYVPGRFGMRPGDVAIVAKGNHHFIILDVDYTSNTLRSVDGNSYGQLIQSRTKQIKYTGPEASTKTVYGYYRILV